GLSATLVVELDYVGERCEAAGVHVRRGLRDVAQAGGAKGPDVRRSLYQAVEFGAAGIGIVTELTGAAERVCGEARDGREATFVLRGDVRSSLRHAQVVELVVGERRP